MGARDAMASICGIHHVKVPVSDVAASRDWYAEVFDFMPTLDFEDEATLLGVVLEHRSGVALLLYLDPERSHALAGFDPVGLAVSSTAELQAWVTDLDQRGVAHTPIRDAHLGQSIEVRDPDGLIIQLNTREQPSAGDTNR